MKRPVQSKWIAALEIAATAIYNDDGGLRGGDAQWRDDDKRAAWLAIRKEISRLENGFAHQREWGPR